MYPNLYPIFYIKILVFFQYLDLIDKEEQKYFMNYGSELCIVQLNKVAPDNNETLGKVTDFTCPKCDNILWEFEDEYLPYFRCGSGHIYSPKSLLTEQITRLKRAFWQEVRLLKVRTLKAKELRLTQ